MADGAKAGLGRRRNRLVGEPDFAIGALLVRPSLREVSYPGGAVRVEPRVMQVLVVLARAETRVLSRDELIDACWGGAIVGDDAINRVLVRLRQLGKASGDQFQVETVRGVGYRLVPVAKPEAVPPKGATPAKRWGYLWALGAAVVVVAAILVWPTQAPAGKIVVLEFETSEPELAAQAESLAERIRGTLSLNALATVARASSDEYREPGTASIAARQGVGFILDGAIRPDGNSLRVVMQVIDAGANLTLWTKEYRRARAESSWLQEQVAAHAAEVLRCALLTRRPGDSDIDTSVLAAFLRACDRVEQYEGGGSDMLVAAEDLTKRAPGFSRAWSMLAMANAFAGSVSPEEQAIAMRSAAEAASARALELDPNNGEAVLALAVLHPQGRDWKERQQLVSRAIALAPDLADAYVLQAELMMETGRVAEAIDQLRRAAALEPLSPIHWTAMIASLSASGNHEETKRIRSRLQQTWPESETARFTRFKNMMFNGEPQGALNILRAGEVRMRDSALGPVQKFLEALVSGDRQDLQAAVQGLATLAREGQYDIPSAVSSASMSGDLDLAFELAELHFARARTAVSIRQPPRGATSAFLFLSPTENLRRDPRFVDLATRIGLVAYWRETGKWPDLCVWPHAPSICPPPSTPAVAVTTGAH